MAGQAVRFDEVKKLFRDIDISCMTNNGIDLSDYSVVRLNAEKIYRALKNRRMPKDGVYWNNDQLALLRKWIDDGANP